MFQKSIAVAAVLLLVAACDDGGQEKGEAAGRTEAEVTGFPIAFGLPRVVASNVYMSRGMVVEAVYQASALSGGALAGRIVNTGTLEPGMNGYIYSPQPEDRLVVKIAGQTHEFVVKQAQGDATAMTSDAWLMAPHDLRYSHRMPGEAEAEIHVRFDGAKFEVAATGWTMQSGKRYDVDLAASGGSSGQIDYHGQEVETSYTLKGRIKGNGIEVDVNERHASSMAAASSLRLPYSMRGSASRFNATLNNILRSNGVQYEMKNVRVQTDTKTKGGDSQAGITLVEGEIMQGGEVFGRCLLRGGRAFLETESGTIALDLPLPGTSGR